MFDIRGYSSLQSSAATGRAKLLLSHGATSLQEFHAFPGPGSVSNRMEHPAGFWESEKMSARRDVMACSVVRLTGRRCSRFGNGFGGNFLLP